MAEIPELDSATGVIAPPRDPASTNPFDAFDAEAAPSLTERARLGMVEGFARGTLAGSAGMYASQRARQDEELVARSRAETERYNNPSPQAVDGETPYQASIRSKAAQRRARDGVTAQNPFDVWDNVRQDLLRYEAMPDANGPLEMLATGVGMLGGGMMSPESMILRVPGAGFIAEKLGAKAGTTAMQMAEAAIAQAFVNTATDPAVQALSMAGNTQQHYDPIRTLLAAPVGAVVGGGLTGAGALVAKGASALGNALTPMPRLEGLTPHEQRAQFPTNEDRRVSEAVTADRRRVAIDDPAMRAANETLDMPPVKATVVPEIRDNPPYYPGAESASSAAPADWPEFHGVDMATRLRDQPPEVRSAIAARIRELTGDGPSLSLSRRLPLEEASPELRAEVEGILDRIVPQRDKRAPLFVDRLRTDQAGAAAHGVDAAQLGDDGTHLVAGMADGLGLSTTIQIARALPNANEMFPWVARHESIHALRRIGLFTADEWRTLVDANTKYGWAENAGKLDSEEGIAEAFAAWGTKRATGDTPLKVDKEIARIFQKIVDFYQRLKESLSGKYREEWERIFSRIETGEVGARDISGSSKSPLMYYSTWNDPVQARALAELFQKQSAANDKLRAEFEARGEYPSSKDYRANLKALGLATPRKRNASLVAATAPDWENMTVKEILEHLQSLDARRKSPSANNASNPARDLTPAESATRPPDPLDMAAEGRLTATEAARVADEAKANIRQTEDAILGPDAAAWRKAKASSERASNAGRDKAADEQEAIANAIEARLTPQERERLNGIGEDIVDPEAWRNLSRRLADVEASRESAVGVIASEVRSLPDTPNVEGMSAQEREAIAVIQRGMEAEQARGGDPIKLLRDAFDERFARYGGKRDAAEVVTSQMKALRDLMGEVRQQAESVRQLAGPTASSSPSGIRFRRDPQAGASGPPTSPPTTTAGAAGAGGPGAAPTPTSPATHEVTSLQAQSLKLADDLGIPLREGRVQGGQNVLGQFDDRQFVARAKAITSFETVAHEAGHGLETKIGPELKIRIQAAQAELGPLDYDPTRQDAGEGFAEFVRLYLTNPAAAQRAAPQFANEFRTFMAAQHPDMLASLDAAQAAHAAYINAPSDVKLDAIVQRTEPETIASRIREDGFAKTVSLMVGRAYEGIFDDKAPVTRAVRDLARMARDASGVRMNLEGSDNPENLVRLFERSMQAGIRDMMDGVRPYHQTVPQGPSLRDALIKATGEPGIFGRWDDVRLKEFSDYLVARRAEVLWRKFEAGDLPNRPTALTKADTLDAIAKAEAANPNFRAASDEVHAYTRELLRKQYEGGLIDRDLYDKLLQEDFYVPLFRDMRDKPSPGKAGGGQSPDGPGMTDTIKRQRGSDRDIIDPVQGIMTQTFLVNRTLAHNDIIRSFVDLARQAQRAGAVGTGRILEEIPAKELVGKRFDLEEVVRSAAQQHNVDPTDTKVLLGSLSDVFGDDPIMGTIFRREPAGKRGEPIVFYKDGGELRAVRLSSKEEGVALYEALAELPPQLRDWAMQLGAGTAQALRLGITTNPVFAFTNFIRDQLAATIIRPDYIPFNPRGLAREVRQDAIAQLYNYAGGVSPGAGSAGLSEFIKGDLEAMARKGWFVQKLAGIGDLFTRGDIKAGAKAIGELVEVSEAGTRLNVMKRVFEQKRAQGLSEYDAMIEAASQATDLMDFGRHGSGTQTIRALVPFLNAHLQGLDKARRTLIEPVTRALRGDMVTEADVSALKNAGLAWFKMAGVGGALGFAYGMYASQHDAYRDANDNLRATHFVIPGGPFGHDGKVLVIPKPFELAIGFNLGELMGQLVRTGDPRVAGFAAEGVREVLAPPNVLTSVPLVKTWLELGLNRSYFTGRDIVPDNLQRLTPAEQVRPNTSTLAKKVGDALGVSPIKVDYAVGSLFGLWGRDLLAASNATDGNGPAAALEDQVFFRRFIKSASSSSESLKRFWDLASAQNGKFAQAKNSYENMTGQFRDADASRFLASLASPERAYVTLNSAADETGRLKFTADEKRLHPLTRGAEAVRILNGYVQELQVNAQKDYGTGQQVAMDPQKRRQAIDAIRVLSAMEQRNALTIMRDKGYEDRKVLSTEDQLATIRALDPRVADEIATRYATKKIAPTDAVARAWPEAQRRLLQDGSQADLSDLALDAKADGYAFGADRVKRPQKRRLVIPSSPVNPGQVQPSP